MYTVSFVGLNYFNACTTGEKKVMIPNGTRAGGHMPTHYASLFIEADHLDSDDWWSDQRIRRRIRLEVRLGEFRSVDVIEFRIPKKVELTFRCHDDTLSNVNLDDGLPKLQALAGFKLDSVGADTIAEVPIPGGAIEAFRFGSSALVRWLIEKHHDPITITAGDGEETRRITLKKSDCQLPTEIVLSNTIDLLTRGNGHSQERGAGNGHGGDMAGAVMHSAAMQSGSMPGDSMGMAAANGSDNHSSVGYGNSGHFMLYAKLDWDRDESKFQHPDLSGLKNFKPLPFHHPYLAFLCTLKEVPDPPCVPTCC
ncbi:MAG TPA: hypothetical protein VN380_12645 [Thermoanaerobaculia bacterium]|jgi:hypothetical protein|nr:hypothetical protein [Thermoanaerobaculia bacterium]